MREQVLKGVMMLVLIITAAFLTAVVWANAPASAANTGETHSVNHAEDWR